LPRSSTTHGRRHFRVISNIRGEKKWIFDILWPFKKVKSCYRAKLQHLPSAIVLNQGSPVAFEMCDPSGFANHLFTIPKHRRKGLGTAVELRFCQNCIRYVKDANAWLWEVHLENIRRYICISPPSKYRMIDPNYVRLWLTDGKDSANNSNLKMINRVGGVIQSNKVPCFRAGIWPFKMVETRNRLVIDATERSSFWTMLRDENGKARCFRPFKKAVWQIVGWNKAAIFSIAPARIFASAGGDVDKNYDLQKRGQKRTPSPEKKKRKRVLRNIAMKHANSDQWGSKCCMWKQRNSQYFQLL
jgi:hypothetical protein